MESFTGSSGLVLISEEKMHSVQQLYASLLHPAQQTLSSMKAENTSNCSPS